MANAPNASTDANADRMTISVLDYGAVGDGIADDTAAIQAAIDVSIYNGDPSQRAGLHRPVHLPAGQYRITKTLHLGYGVGGFSSVTLQGDGDAYAGHPAFGGTTLIADFWDGLAINAQGARGTKIRGLTILGRNRDWILNNDLGGASPLLDDTNPANWVDPAAPASASSRYAPYAGIAIDCYSGPRPGVSYPDVTYPAFLGSVPQYGKTYSSNVLIEDVTISGFVACDAVQPCDDDANGDFTKLNRVNMDCFVWGVSVGNTQSRNVSIRDVTANRGHCVLTSKTHGRQNGKFQGPITNLSVGNCTKLFSFGSTSIAAPITFTNCYAENLHQLGDLGLGTASETSVVFQGCKFGFEAQTDARGVPALTVTGDGAAVDLRFEGCTINNVPSVFVVGSPQLKMIGSRVLALSRKLSALPDRATALAHNALAGGVVAGRLDAAPGQSIIYVPFNADTLLQGQPVTAQDGMRLTSRPWCIPNHVRLAQPKDDPHYCPAVKQENPRPIAKSSVTTSITGRTLTLTFASRSEGRFVRQGPLPGDVILDDLTRTVFFVKTRDGLTITAEAQNNYKNGQILEPVSMAVGNWYILNARLYVPDHYFRTDTTASSVALSNAGSDDGYAAWMPTAIQPGDYAYVADTVDRWVSPDGARVVTIVPGTITLAAGAAKTETRKRIPVFIRGT